MAPSKRDEDDLDSESLSNDSSRSSSESEAELTNSDDRGDNREENYEDKEDSDDDEEMEESKVEVKEESDSDEERDSDDDMEVTHAVDADDVLADLNLDDDDEDEGREAAGGEEREEEQPEEIPITRIEVEIPKIPTELGNDIHFVKLPNFLSADTHPYDPSWYEDEMDEDEILDEEGRHRLKKLNQQ